MADADDTGDHKIHENEMTLQAHQAICRLLVILWVYVR